MNAEADDPIMLSALQHWSYCPRQCALIHLEQAFDENIHTMRGNAAHERVDEPGFETFEGVRGERALPVWSERLGLIGKCDMVEFHPDGRIYPVEYKHGKKREKLHDDLQLAAQAMCLEEMTGKVITHGAIYHHSSRRRREVFITQELRDKVEETVNAIHAMLASGKLPSPANDARCKECSLKEICQPQVIAERAVQRSLLRTLFEPEASQ
jgi:CRISPR-associated exonuclease Cas4